MKESKSKHLHMDTTHSRKKNSIAFTLHNVKKELQFGAPISPLQHSLQQSPFPFLLIHNLSPNILCTTFYACGGNAQNLGGGVIQNFKRKI
jgi:hypothetical protein